MLHGRSEASLRRVPRQLRLRVSQLLGWTVHPGWNIVSRANAVRSHYNVHEQAHCARGDACAHRACDGPTHPNAYAHAHGRAYRLPHGPHGSTHTGTDEARGDICADRESDDDADGDADHGADVGTDHNQANAACRYV